MMPSLLHIQLPSADTHEIEHGQIANTHGPEPRWILQLKASPFLIVPPQVMLQDLGFGGLLMPMTWRRPGDKRLWEPDQALAVLVAKVGSISHSKKDTGTRDKSRERACGHLATEVATADATPNRQDRGTWDKLLQGNSQVQVQGNHPPCSKREGWSQLDSVALGCS